MPADLVIRRAVVAGRPAEVRCAGGRIAEVAPRVERRPGDEIIDAGGGEVLPGLVDHHLHIRALAAAGASVAAGPPEVRDPAQLAAALRAGRPGEWVRAVGYHESVAGVLDAAALDALVDDRPVRLQHRGGSLWVLNSAALAVLDVAACSAPGVERDAAGRPTGRLWRMDRWLGEQIGRRPVDLAGASRAAASQGVTGWTDATPDRSQDDADDLAAAAADGSIRQRLCLMAPPQVHLPTGAPAAIGPVKLLLDDTDLPGLDDLVAAMTAGHRAGRAVAVHCVTRVQLALTLAAFDAAGTVPGDRIEHGALIAPEQLADLRRLRLTVITQPGMVATRGDEYLADVPPEDLPDLWRLASLRRAGVAVAGATDAPFGPPDLWQAIRAATLRRTPNGRVLGAGEAIGLRDAVALHCGPPETPARPAGVRAGERADLCVLAQPLDDHSKWLSTGHPVTVTIVGGRVVWRLSGND